MWLGFLRFFWKGLWKIGGEDVEGCELDMCCMEAGFWESLTFVSSGVLCLFCVAGVVGRKDGGCVMEWLVGGTFV